MTDFAAARLNMVESQVRPNGVTDRRILDAMMAVPRERFVPGDLAAKDVGDYKYQPLAPQKLRSGADPASIEACVQQSVTLLGGLDGLVNNGAITNSGGKHMDEIDVATWDRVMAVNVRGVFLGCKYAIPAMQQSGGGSIVNVASFVAHMGAATPQVAYTASKGAVLAMTRELAVVHAREGIRVNALCPGPLRTELLMRFLDTDEKKRRRLVHVPMGRFGEAKEMAQAALWLASDASSYVTGSTFLVDGGLTAAYVTPE